MKDSSGETSRTQTTNLPIAPYPSPQELYRLRMAELQKLLQSKGTFKSELMQAFLAAAQQSFREHSRSGGANNNNNSGAQQTATSTTTTAGPINGGPVPSNPISIPADVNLNPDPIMLSNSLKSGSLEIPNVGSPSSLQAPSPFLPDLTMADFSPLTPGGTNLNTDVFDNKIFMGVSGAANLNGNSLYSPGAQNINDNIPSPLDMPSLDNLDPCSPSSFMTFNTNQLASPDSVTLENTNNLNNMHPGPSGASTFSPGPSTENMNRINSGFMVQPNTNLMSPSAIKKEVKVEPVMTRQVSICANRVTKVGIMVKDEPLEDLEDKDDAIINNPINYARVEKIMAEVKKATTAERLVLIDQVTDTITEAHLATTSGTRDMVKAAFEKIEASSSPEMPDISSLTVGPNTLWEKLLASMVPEISRVVRFGKKVPGFVEVGEDDQVKLIKQGSFEVMLARHSMLVDPIKETMLDPTLSVASPRSMIKRLPMGDFLDEVFMIAKRVQPMHLHDSELGMFSAILLICPDRNDLINEKSVRVIQQLYQQALYFLMMHLHADTYETRFRTLMSLVPMFQKVNNDHANVLNAIKLKSPAEFDKSFPALAKEIFQDE